MYKVHQNHLTVSEMKELFKAKWTKFINSTDQPSTSTKLQTALCTTTVSMEAPRSGQTGFYISNTVKCFWRTLY
jgi:hypothetical protein